MKSRAVDTASAIAVAAFSVARCSLAVPSAGESRSTRPSGASPFSDLYSVNTYAPSALPSTAACRSIADSVVSARFVPASARPAAPLERRTCSG